MKGLAKAGICLGTAAILLSCKPSEDSKYDSGYDDGYAEGYNTTLAIRATIVKGDWGDESYSRGYKDGRAEGVRDALAEKTE
ncbi:MAG: hypothetical protein EAZ84_12200 [Verrucomicrobia bacterium]|nr:MAG: hypothetical protein EAZ84_12200 [Verrucomicrobiota bacterium]TAE88768.1 MAG: hypothetical protein EAZ82_03455 [Verrucomicrobiota bacterium]TAF26569.1 MAG: hypothetical protein EAZ71_04980 [Verrucomicrobiota bacterium]